MALEALGKITPPSSRIVVKSELSVLSKRLILWEFLGAVLHQGYASDAVLLPSLGSSQRESITFGEICATRSRKDLDAVRRDPPRGGLCFSIGRVVFPGGVRRIQGERPQSVQWCHPGVIFEDIAQKRR